MAKEYIQSQAELEKYYEDTDRLRKLAGAKRDQQQRTNPAVGLGTGDTEVNDGSHHSG